MVIGRAIKKYGRDNFLFELLYSGLSIEDAETMEIKLIKEKNTRVPNGYNVSFGGNLGTGNPLIGTKNGRSLLTEEDVIYIKSHRDLPEYVLFEKFNERISYDAFKNIYLDNTYKNILPTVEPYSYNMQFSIQFANSELDYEDIVSLREQFSKGIYWREAYKSYQDIYSNEWSFWNVYFGNSYSLVMPEVFTKENKMKQSSFANRGTANGRSKLKEEDVILIRELHKQGKTNQEIYNIYPQCTHTTILYILNGKTWKYLL
jgi:hypothetical protein